MVAPLAAAAVVAAERTATRPYLEPGRRKRSVC